MIVVPYVDGMLKEATLRAVADSGQEYRLCRLERGDDRAYGQLLIGLWAAGRTFVIVEQDVIPTTEQLATILSCGHDWCVYPYHIDDSRRSPLLGFTRFDARVMGAHPHAFRQALTGNELPKKVARMCIDTKAEFLRLHPDDEQGYRKWWSCDHAIGRDLMIRGVRWDMHLPPVAHDHDGPPSYPLGGPLPFLPEQKPQTVA